jgi:hypothetical protein
MEMQEKPQRKKRQHFVPRHYLKKLSNGNDFLYVYPFVMRECYKNNINNLCKENFFYGEDDRSQKFENGLSNFEDKHAQILKKIIDSASLNILNENEYVEFVLFLLLQDARTKRSKWEIQKFTQVLIDNVFKPQMKARERPSFITDEWIDKLEIRFIGDFALRMWGATRHLDGLMDLKAILINNVTNQNFFCSDHPVVRYNYIKFENSSSIDYLAPGLMIFFPISNEIMVLLYDEKAYSIDLDFDSIYCLDNGADLESINKLQFISASDCILFSDVNELADVKRIHREINEYMGHEYRVDKEETLHEDGSKTLVLHHHSDRPYFHLDLSFVSLNRDYAEFCMENYKTATKDNLSAKPIRSLKLAAKVEEHLHNSETEMKKIMEQNFGKFVKIIIPPSP